jgi:hypothetical protein
MRAPIYRTAGVFTDDVDPMAYIARPILSSPGGGFTFGASESLDDSQRTYEYVQANLEFRDSAAHEMHNYSDIKMYCPVAEQRVFSYLFPPSEWPSLPDLTLVGYDLPLAWVVGRLGADTTEGIISHRLDAMALITEPVSFSATAWDVMKPGLDNKFSALNFLYELKDLKPLYHDYLKNRGAYKKCFRILWNCGHLKLRDIWRQLAEVHLEWSFGIKPFVSDCAKIYQILKNLDKQLTEIVDGAGKHNTRHYRSNQDFPYLDDTINYGPLVIYKGAYLGVSVRRQVEPIDDYYAHATADYSYSVPDYSGMQSDIRKYLAAFGVNLDAQIIWNAIPFSFVVDWFCNVGDWFHSRRIETYPVITTLWDFCISNKWHESELYIFSEPHGEGDVASCYVNSEIYSRWKVTPPNYRKFESNDLTVSEALLGSSLIGVTGRKHHR